jgi:hypothetical protein
MENSPRARSIRVIKPHSMGHGDRILNQRGNSETAARWLLIAKPFRFDSVDSLDEAEHSTAPIELVASLRSDDARGLSPECHSRFFQD